MFNLVKRFLAAGLLSVTAAAAFAADRPEIASPLYPEIVLETDDSYAADAGLMAFRESLMKAADSLVVTAQGKVYDPEAILPFLASEVEFFVGKGDGVTGDEFVSLGLHPSHRALEMAGRMSRGSISSDPIVFRRHGMHALARLAAEPAVGRTAWLDGRICTASYGRISWPDWIRLDGKLRLLDRSQWVIASVITGEGTEDLSTAGWPKKYQMVPISPLQKRSGGSLGVTAPNGGVVFFRTFYGPNASYFAPYLNSHLCFEELDGVWKVSAVAMRLD